MKRIDVAIAVVLKGNRILICQRRQEDTLGGFWEFPGGKCEDSEDLEECLARELKEEIDVEATIIRPLKPIQHDYPHAQIRLHPFLCEYRAGNPRPIECQNLKWIEAQELGDYRFPPANDLLLREIRETLQARSDSQE